MNVRSRQSLAERDGDNPRSPRERASSLLSVRELSKIYPGVTALGGIDFDLREGELHAIVGENGAGKSTLIKILAGAIEPTRGIITVDGIDHHRLTPALARQLGIAVIYQEFTLVSTLSASDNVYLGEYMRRGPFLRQKLMESNAEKLFSRLGVRIDPRALVEDLTTGYQQIVEIAKAISKDARLLIMDEPSAPLTASELEAMYGVVDALKREGITIVYISHRLDEIFRLSDRVTVLRDGKHIATVAASEVDEDELVGLMTGRTVGAVFPNIAFAPAKVVLEIDGMTTASCSVRDASIHVRSGEIIGLAGLVGSGKSEIVRAAFGLERVVAGRVRLGGKDVTNQRPRQLLKAGVFYLPPDRRVEGLAMMRSCRENIMLAALDRPGVAYGPFLNRPLEQRAARQLAAQVNLHPMLPGRAVEAFSGGNQQKVLIARGLTRPFQVYIFDEPTVGVDVITRASIYRFIASLCEAGAAVVLVSSDLPEVLHLAHRAYVFYGGRVQAELAGETLTEATILPYFFERQTA